MDNSVKLIILLCMLTCISVSLDITILRQISGFIYLSFIPGYLFLRILKASKDDRLEIAVFSFGVSISFLMFIGLVLNEVFLALNISRPLTTIPLLITVSGLTLVLFLLSYIQKDKEAESSSLGKPNVATILQVCSLCALPALSIFGALYNNTLLLLLMILGVAVVCTTSSFSDYHPLIHGKIVLLAIASSSIALLLPMVLISKYFTGWDIFREFYVFKLTEIAGCWYARGTAFSLSPIDSLNSILSITILPTIYSAILAIDGEILFKLFYPFVLSLMPLVLYRIYEKQTSKTVALLSVLFFISSPSSYYGMELLSLSRQIMGQFFFILFMLVLLENKLTPRKKRILLAIFGSSLIVSHYAIAYIFLLYILGIFVVSRMRISSFRTTINALDSILILFLTTLTFSWYNFVSATPLYQASNIVLRILSSFSRDMFSAEARFQQVLLSLSPLAPASLIGMIHKTLIYLQFLFIGIGIIVLLIKPREFRLYTEFRLTATVSFLILLVCLTIPNFAPAFNMTRFYLVIIPFLAPFYVLGGAYIFGRIGKLKLQIVSSILIAIFLFQVGFVNHITNGYPDSYSLDLDRRKNSNDLSIVTDTHRVYFLDQEVQGARWLLDKMNLNLKVYSDLNSKDTVLKSYALLSDGKLLPIVNGTRLEPNTYIYLKYLNVQIGIIFTGTIYLNISDILPVLEACNKIYSNGGSDIYYNP